MWTRNFIILYQLVRFDSHCWRFNGYIKIAICPAKQVSKHSISCCYFRVFHSLNWENRMELRITSICFHQYCQFDFMYWAGDINRHKTKSVRSKTNGWTHERTNKWMNAWMKNKLNWNKQREHSVVVCCVLVRVFL